MSDEKRAHDAPQEQHCKVTDFLGNLQASPTQPDFTLTDNPDAPTHDVKELPTWGLPRELQNVAEEVTAGYQCSRDYVVASMMVAASTMLGKRVQSVFGSHKNYPTLWVAIVGGSASGKTAPLSFCFKPIELMEREAFKAYQRDLQQWNDADKKGAKPEWHHYLLSNPTDESVAYELSVNGSLCWKCDELRTTFGAWGKYSKNANGGDTIVGNLLSIHNYIDVSFTRVTREPIYLTEPNLNFIGGIQPSVLKRVMGDKGFTEDGLFQRFVFVFPEPTDIPPFADVAISDHARDVWSDTIQRLARVGDLTLRETETAKKLHIEAINRWRVECKTEYNNTDAMIALLRKLEIHLCRWSIVVAVLSGQREITADVMRYSIECMEYFKKCGEKAYCLIANPDTKPKELSNGELLRLLQERFPDLNQSQLAKAISRSQQYVSKELNK